MAPSKDLTACVHTIIRRTIGQYDVNKAVQHGATWSSVQLGSVTFVQRCGGSINLHLHVHVLFLEGVCVDRAAQGLQPRFLPADLTLVVRAWPIMFILPAGSVDSAAGCYFCPVDHHNVFELFAQRP